MKSIHVAALLLLALGASCQTLTRSQVREVDDGLWAYVGENDKQEVAAARDARDRAEDELAVSERRIEEARDQLTLAKREFDVADARFDEARAALKVGEKAGEEEDLSAEHAGVERASAWRDAARAAIDWRALDVDAARAQRVLAARNLELANARIELAKARAVDRLDHPDAEGVGLAQFELQVRERSTQRQIAEIMAEAADREVAIARNLVPELPSEAQGQ